MLLSNDFVINKFHTAMLYLVKTIFCDLFLPSIMSNLCCFLFVLILFSYAIHSVSSKLFPLASNMNANLCLLFAFNYLHAMDSITHSLSIYSSSFFFTLLFIFFSKLLVVVYLQIKFIE